MNAVSAHLISIHDLSNEWIVELFNETEALKSGQIKPSLNNQTASLLFYENSTRTKASFRLAMNKLGCQIIDLEVASSSIKKGENLKDTIQTLVNLGSKIIVIRHPSSSVLSQLVNDFREQPISIINAGDGMREHPTQALTDLFSIVETLDFDYERLRGKRIAIIGDCLHSRVARSNIYLLQRFGMEITLVGPPNLVPQTFTKLGVTVEHDLIKGIQGMDYIMALRIQFERQDQKLISSLSEYAKYYCINEYRLLEAGLNPDQIKILHPGPVNRGLEISSHLVDNKNVSLINQQVQNGLLIRTNLIHRLKNVMISRNI